jgi:hypothetical protein
MSLHITAEALPTFSALNTAHWPSDQQSQFGKAIDGIQSAPWFQAIDAPALEKERLATACAFAVFSHLRNRMRLAPDDELILDAAGRRADNC